MVDEIDVNECNQIYKVFENNFIFGKTDPKTDKYDEIVHVFISVEKLEIPPFIKKISDLSYLKIESITIPDHVTEIGSYSFNECYLLKRVEFSENSKLQIIDSYAFQKCNNIESIIILPNVIAIHKKAFSKCRKLKQVFFYKNSKLQTIGIKAFSDSSIEYIVIPPTVLKIEDDIFSNCNNLAYIFINTNLISEKSSIPNTVQIKSNQYLYKGDDDEYYLSFDFNEEEKNAKVTGLNSKTDFVAIPRSVIQNEKEYIITEICKGAFENSEVKIIHFPPDSEVHIIGENSFAKSLIHSILIPSNVAEICNNAFDNCPLRNVLFISNSKLSKIGKNAFSHTLIEEISITPSVKQISTDAFSDCNSLKKIIFDENSEFNLQQFGFISENKTESPSKTEYQSSFRDDKEEESISNDSNEEESSSNDNKEEESSSE